MLDGMRAHRPPDWLQPLLGNTQVSSLLVGGVGHLLLSREEEVVICAALEERVLPLLREIANNRPITLFTGLAPGADVLLMDCASRWCRRNQVILRKVGICPVPLAHLAADWLHHAESMGHTISPSDRQRVTADIQRVHADCAAVIPLYNLADDDRAFNDARVRQIHYRKLAGVLAEHSDQLLAILHQHHAGQPGGTAEVVAWRENPSKIPAEFSTRDVQINTGAHKGLIIIHPMLAKVTTGLNAGEHQIRDVLAQAKAAIQKGNELLANDILYRALQSGLKHPDLSYLRVQSLASIGSSDLALREYAELAPAPSAQDERWITLRARIQKDFGLRSGCSGFFLESAEHYLDAWLRFGSSYSVINAASMYALGHNWQRARELAKKALNITVNEESTGTENAYFIAATSAEAALILGDLAAVHCQLTKANQCEVGLVHRRRTLRQLQRLCAALDISSELLAPLKLPPLIVLRRLTPTTLDLSEAAWKSLLSTLPANASIYLGLIDDFDLALAERLLQSGHTLSLVLPYPPQRWLDPASTGWSIDWNQRLERCLTQASHVHVELGFLQHELEWAASNVTERVLGLALLSAYRAGGSLHIIDIDTQQPVPSFNTRASLMAGETITQKTSVRLHAEASAVAAPRGRRMVGLIFADFVGFQRIEDTLLPQFWGGPMQAIAQFLAHYGDRVLHKNTWGDGLHVVTEDANTAASIMADIQHYMALQEFKLNSPLAPLTLRIAGHYAPAYEGFDTIQGTGIYFGTQLSLAARIEPVTPPGQIYATEAFATRLIIENASQFALEYAGEIELAKRFGPYRLYSLRRLES